MTGLPTLLPRKLPPRFGAPGFGPARSAAFAAPPRRRSLAAAPESARSLRARGAIVAVRIGQPGAVAEKMREEGRDVPEPATLDAMLDTGASISAIDRGLAEKLGLVQVGSVPIAGVTGVQEQPVYMASVSFDRPAATFDPVRLTGASIGVQQFHVLVGRDIMEQMTLVYDGPNGEFRLGGEGEAALPAGAAPSAGWLPKAVGIVTAGAAVFTVVGLLTRLFRFATR